MQSLELLALSEVNLLCVSSSQMHRVDYTTEQEYVLGWEGGTNASTLFFVLPLNIIPSL